MPKSDGWFKKGHDPRRFVHRPTEVIEFRKQLAAHLRELSPLAAKLLKDTLKGKPVTKLQVLAARDILDRVAGTPVNSIVIETIDGPSGKDVSKYTNAELSEMIKNLGGDDVINVKSVVIENDSTSPDAEAATREALKQVGIE